MLVVVLSVVGAPLGAARGPPASVPVWDDVSGDAGVMFRHAGEIHPDRFAPLWPAFPEIMGGGACWGDFDGDGYQDLYLVNQQYNELNEAAGDWVDDEDPTNKLYLNDGDGAFTDATEAAGVASRSFGYACSAADYDADGDLDLFVSGFDVTELYRNNGDGTFTDVAEAAGVDKAGTCGDFACFTTSSAWADYDADGDLDLYALNYVESFLEDLGRGPNFHTAQVNWLFRNDGDGTFTEMAEAAGVQGLAADENGGKSLGVVWFDCELDGDLDLFVANDETPDDFYRNNGDGTFVEFDDAGLADPRAGMGVAAADYDGDGLADVFITHYAGEDDGFYRNNGDCTFEDRSGEDDLATNFDFVSWGTAFVDWDRDMDLDLAMVGGHTETLLDYEQPMKVYRNDANPVPGADPWDRVWVDVAADAGPDMADERVRRGAAWADYDLDGDVDFATVANANDTAQLFRASGVTGHWLRVELDQPGMNPDGVGARVTVQAGGVRQVRELQTGTSYLSQNDLALDFGLGSNLKADRVTVEWPGLGSSDVFENVPADRVVRVDGATATFVTDTLSPLTSAALAGAAGGAGWWRSPVAATVTAADRAVGVASGVAATQSSLDGGPWTAPGAEPLSVAGEGVHTLRFRSVDAVGNQEPARLARVPIDFTPPTLTFILEGQRGRDDWWVSPDVAVDLRAADGLSGVEALRFRLDGGEWQAFAGPVVVRGDGLHRVEATARDLAGNEAATQAVDLAIDSTPPDVQVLRPGRGQYYVGSDRVAVLEEGPAVVVTTPRIGGQGGPGFRVEADAADATSGVDGVQFLVGGVAVAADDEPPHEWTWPTAAYAPGPYELEAAASDRAGNTNRTAVTVLLVPVAPDRELGGAPASLPPGVEVPAPASWDTVFGRRPGVVEP